MLLSKSSILQNLKENHSKPVEVHFSGRAPAVYQRKPGDQQTSLQQFQAIVWHHCRPGRGRLSRNRMFLLPASCLSAQICVPTLGDGWLIFVSFYSNTPYKINTSNLQWKAGLCRLTLKVISFRYVHVWIVQTVLSSLSSPPLGSWLVFPASTTPWVRPGLLIREITEWKHTNIVTHIVWDKKPQGKLSAVYRHWKASLSGCPTFQDEQKRKWVCLLLLTQQEWHRVKEQGKVWWNWSKAFIFWLLLWTLANPDWLASLLQFTSSVSDSRKPAVWSAVRSIPSMLFCHNEVIEPMRDTHTHMHTGAHYRF